MLLNQTEQRIASEIKRLRELGLIEGKLVFAEDGQVEAWVSSIAITEKGIQYIDKGGYAVASTSPTVTLE